MQAATGIENLDIIQEMEQKEKENDGIGKDDGDYANPVADFLIALETPETKRQYPKRPRFSFIF